MSERHVLVVGAGIVGLSVAYYARLKGLRVTVVERHGPARDAASYGNSGLLVPSHIVPLAAPGAVTQGLRWMANPESPFWVRPTLDPKLWRWGWRFLRSSTEAHVARSAPLLRDLNRASLQHYREMARALGTSIGFQQRGLLMLCRTPLGVEEEARIAERAHALGMAADVLDARGVAELEPGVSLDVAGGVFYPGDAQLDPGRTMAALQAWLDRNGVRFLWHREVRGWHVNGRIQSVRALRTIPLTQNPRPPAAPDLPPDTEGFETTPGLPEDDPAPLVEDLDVDEVVLAAGVWSETLAELLGLDLPMRAGRGTSVTLPDPPEKLGTPAILSEARVALSPLGRGLRIGGTMEIVDPDAPNAVSAARLRGIARSVADYWPALRPATLRALPVWTGLRPTTPDGLPYLGRSPRHPNLIVATGHAMMGMSLGPVTGELVADLLTGETPPIDLAPLRVDRFA